MATPIHIFYCWIAVQYCMNMNISDTCKCGEINENRKIYNGQEAKPHGYPWMVAVSYTAGDFCGGSLINDRYVLTAGHCVYGKNKDDAVVYLGYHDMPITSQTREMRKIKSIRMRPDFVLHYGPKADPLNDIALLELDEPIANHDHVGQICLPLEEDFGKFGGFDAKVLGWGIGEVIKPADSLQETTLRVLTNDECQKWLFSDIITSTMICGLGENGSNACQGDSGGPLFTERSGRFEQIGLVSAGVWCGAHAPAKYTRVSEYLDWIIAETKNAVYCSYN